MSPGPLPPRLRSLLLVPVLLLSSCAVVRGQWERTAPRTSRPPKIDGVLAPDEWQGAATIEDLKQTEPVEGAEPSEKTIVYLLVDADNLYIGVQCLDSDPAGIIATQRTRDADLDPDDRIELIVDTFHDRRNAYFFQLSPAGSKGDALIAGNGSFFNKDWDGIWQGRSTIHDQGWSCEFAIPARTLSLDPQADAWGFNIVRQIKRRTESVEWATPTRTQRLFNIASAGTITGVGVLEQGLGLDVIPYISLRGNRNHASGDDDLFGDIGLDMRFRILPSLAATLTINTDFAQTEVDDQIVNLTRFPVFFPEKRDFFLEDAGIFAFGGLNRRRGVQLLPFFSRRIGLSEDGEPVTLLAGAKVTGRVDDVSIGFMDVVQDESAGVDVKNLTILRPTLNVLDQSQVGAIFTWGDPTTGGDNVLGGIDFTYRTDEFLEDRTLRFDAFVLGSWDDPDRGSDDSSEVGYAYGFRFDYPNDLIEADFEYREVSSDFRPDLGFVRRRGVRNIDAEVMYRPRPDDELIRRFTFGVDPNLFLSIRDDDLDSFTLRTIPLEILFESGDRLGTRVTPTWERLTEPFEIHDGVTLPTGRYSFERFMVFFEFSDKRPLSGRIRYSTGSFFNGTRSSWQIRADWRPLSGLNFESTFERNDISLDGGAFHTHLARLRVSVDFTPDLTWSTFIQFDDVSDSISINSRIRWIIEPGNDLFLVFNRGFETRDRGNVSIRPTESEFTAKLSWTFRF